MLNARKHVQDVDATGNFPPGINRCQVIKDSIARIETIRECIYKWLYNSKMKPTLGLKSTSYQYANATTTQHKNEGAP
jgi:hypothetical protein